MNIAVDVSAAAKGAAALEDELKEFGTNLAALKHSLNRLESNTVTFVAETLGLDVAQIGDALRYFGIIHDGMGLAFRGLQGLHAAAHEASERLLPSDPSPQSGGGGGKEPPPKP